MEKSLVLEKSPSLGLDCGLDAFRHCWIDNSSDDTDLRVDLAFHHRTPADECWVSPDLEKFLTQIWLSERGPYHLTQVTGHGYKNTVWIRGSENTKPIIVTFVSQKFLRERRE